MAPTMMDDCDEDCCDTEYTSNADLTKEFNSKSFNLITTLLLLIPMVFATIMYNQRGNEPDDKIFVTYTPEVVLTGILAEKFRIAGDPMLSLNVGDDHVPIPTTEHNYQTFEMGAEVTRTTPAVSDANGAVIFFMFVGVIGALFRLLTVIPFVIAVAVGLVFSSPYLVMVILWIGIVIATFTYIQGIRVVLFDQVARANYRKQVNRWFIYYNRHNVKQWFGTVVSQRDKYYTKADYVVAKLKNETS